MAEIFNARSLKYTLEAGGKANPFWICGPCVVENHDTMAKIGEKIATISQRYQIPFVFKASFDKANRTSHKSFRSLGMEKALKELAWVKNEFNLPVLTDVHESHQVSAAAEVADILQIPAFLCRQTDLIEAACKTGRLINVKKGQFLSPSNVKNILEKLEAFESAGHWITERGVSFGYQRLIVDFAAFPEMEAAGAKIVLDITHSVQLPGAGDQSGGMRTAIPYLARCGAAAGVTGFFAETHPNPSVALSDGANAIELLHLEEMVRVSQSIAQTWGSP